MVKSYPKGPKQPQNGHLSEMKQNVVNNIHKLYQQKQIKQYINMTYWVWKMMRFWILRNQQDL